MNTFTTITAAAALAASASLASATPLMSLTNPLTGNSSVTVSPGGTFSISVVLTTDEPFDGTSFYLQSDAAGFSVTSDTSGWSGPSGNPLNFANNFIYPAAIPTAGNSRDFGFEAQNPTQNVAVGKYDVATLDLVVSGLMAPGSYTVSSTPDSEISDASFSSSDIHNIPSATYSVIVVPEPAGLPLLVTGCALVLLARRQKMRT